MTQRSSQLRRLPVLAALALVGLSACGDPEPSTSATTETVAPAADGMRAPSPIEYSAARGANGAEAPMASPAPESADSRVAADMIAPTYVADFVAADGLVLPGNSTGWVYDAAGRGSAEMAAQIAAAFGVSGAVTRVDDWYPGGWQIGPTDGSGDSFFLSDDAQLTWSFSPRWVDQGIGASVGCATPAYDPGTDVAPPDTFEPCVVDTVPSPVGVPTGDEAEARARELLAALGIDSSEVVFDTYADDWSASVAANEPIGGLAEGASNGRTWSFGFGAEGALTWASGVAAAPEPVGPYALVDLPAALERLKEYRFGMGFPVDLARSVGVAEPAVAVDPPAPDAAPPATTPTDVAILPAPIDDVPVGTYPEPEPVTVTLVDVQPDVWWVWDADGAVWVVPAYRFIGDDGGWYTVPAVADEYLVPAEPLPDDAIMPVPVPATVPDPGTPDDPGIPDTPVTEPAATPTTTTPEATVPDPDPEPSVPPVDEGPTFHESVGKTIDDFTADAEASGYTVRITEIDGQPQPVTMDYRTDRVNVAVTTGDDGTQTVTAIINVG